MSKGKRTSTAAETKASSNSNVATASPLDEKLLTTWAKNFFSRKPEIREAALRGLIGFIAYRIAQFTQEIRSSLGDASTSLPDFGSMGSEPALQATLFEQSPAVTGEGELFVRCGTVVRDQLIAWLERVVVEKTARDRLPKWLEFHRRSRDLPGDVRAVYDATYYAGRSVEQAAELLGQAPAVISQHKATAIAALRPLIKAALGR